MCDSSYKPQQQYLLLHCSTAPQLHSFCRTLTKQQFTLFSMQCYKVLGDACARTSAVPERLVRKLPPAAILLQTMQGAGAWRMQNACGNRRTQVGKSRRHSSLLLLHQASCQTCCRNMAEQNQGQALDWRLRCLVLNTGGFPKTASPGQTARQRHAGCLALCAARRLSIHATMVLRISSLPGSLMMTCQRSGMMCSSLSADAARS